MITFDSEEAKELRKQAAERERKERIETYVKTVQEFWRNLP